MTLQWDYTKDGGKVTPMYSVGEPTSFTISMKYKCSHCKKVVDACDPLLLHNLPYFISSVYPVDCGCILKHFHLSKRASFFLDSTMVTYGNCDFVKKYMMQKQKALYDEKLHKYVDKIKFMLSKTNVQY